ncbi:hypothetical protein BP5796_08806 [Coleophoma crateriformis]|uniref:Rab-GAP TBC domain-containing protein n=1 Tax=Coleophoma crateriformis TaxID=565419 RepID=A0A3D8R8N3_9HELO|nr:hypothetical protein BP5796_08806 [Coleophoma crateriformis]
MSVAQGQHGNGVAAQSSSYDGDSLHIRRQRSMKFSLYPSRPRTSSRDNAGPPSPIAYIPSRSSPPEQETALAHSVEGRPSTSSYTSATESFRSFTPPTNAQRPIQKRPSEASRLRALNHGHSRSPDGRRTPDRARTPENFSRPRAPSLKRANDPPRPLLQASNTFPLGPHDEEQTPTQWSVEQARDRGLSTSSSQSNYKGPMAPTLRPSTSIPDYHAPESIYSRQRNLNNPNYPRAQAAYSQQDNYAVNRREPAPRPPGFDDEEVRASFRSALTTSSSYMGTSGTERSSVMTKSSSATSIYGRDEGMTVDDAIGMYSGGFVDSEVESQYAVSRPGTANSEFRRRSRLEEAMNDNLALPTLARPLVRDSTAIFQMGLGAAVVPPAVPSIEESRPRTGIDGGSMDIQDTYFDRKTPSRPVTRAAPTINDPNRDRYGFRKKTQYLTKEEYDTWDVPYTEYLARRKKKWVALLKENNMMTTNPTRFPPKTAKIKRFVRKGIPPEWRGEAWFYYAGGPAMIAKHHGVYDDLIAKAAAGQVTETDNEIIERDLNRTFPDNIKFKPDPPGGEAAYPTGNQQPVSEAETPILQSLRRVLQAFSIYNPKIGYCQSLNFLAGLLLLFMNEEKSFWMLNIITRVYLPGTHEVNLEGANVDLGVLMTSIKESMPAIWAKIGGELDGTAGDGKVSMRLPPITLCCTAWFMSCFIGTLPIESTLRVWDSFFLEGSKTLFRIAMAVFKMGEVEIRAVSDPMEIFQVVQTIPRKLIDANALMEICFFKRRNGFGHISQATIESRRAERRAGYAEERAKANGEIAISRKGTLFKRKLKAAEL